MQTTLASTVLMIEDDRDVRMGTKMRLQIAGYRTLEAENGLEGVATAIEQQPDVILLDVRMPQMDGLTALAHLRENALTRDIPVIMLSASLVDQTAALDNGARFFLAKPYQGPQMLEAISTALETADR
ncbi:MAG: response regulator [Planctomycetaceae bacterium]